MDFSGGKKKQCGAIPLDSCLAKTRHGKNGKIAGRTVEEHCRIAGEVARQLLEGYYSRIANLFPEYAWIMALVHDIGKVSPTFQKKIRQAINVLNDEVANAKVENERIWGGHPAVGYATIRALSKNDSLANIVGYHHGRNFTRNRSSFFDYGGQEWEDLRRELVARLVGDFPLPDISGFMQEILVLGLVILADWIASGEIFDDPDADWRELVQKAISDAGFIIPDVRSGLEFGKIFSFKPNEIQKAFVEQINGPGVYVLEAPMGMGKTEAALMVAYKLLEAGKASGIYFGLPTRLTSNKIFERVDKYLGKILENRTIPILVHGSARLKKFMDQHLGKDAAPGGSWFDENKRGLLAPFAVGTLDQALLSVMHVRHAALRALGLAGKVVILDEVHSYDAYTGELLDVLVERLREFGCTVIILSATLTNERRQKLLGCITESAATAYPLLTLAPDKGAVVEVPVHGPEQKSVKLRIAHDDGMAVEEALLRAEKGQQVLWIENTVRSAQERFRRLASRAEQIKVECGLLHSRFTPRDRENNEKYWTDIYGKDSPLRSECGRILVGTQVLEQSLDLDADFLVTRLCPTDMLLQRIGRLWRHDRNNRANSAAREAWILSPGLETVLDNPSGSLQDSGTSYIYAPYVLGRTLEVWAPLENVALPDDIRDLLEKTYLPRDEKPSSKMDEAKHSIMEKCEQKRSLALSGVANVGKILDDDEVGTRLAEGTETRLLLLRDLDLENGTCVCLDGTRCALRPVPQNRADRTAIACALAMNILNVPGKGAPDKLRQEYLEAFAPYIFEAKTWRKDNKIFGGKLRIALVSEGQRLGDIFGNNLPDIHYSDKVGYYIDNKQDNGTRYPE